MVKQGLSVGEVCMESFNRFMQGNLFEGDLKNPRVIINSYLNSDLERKSIEGSYEAICKKIGNFSSHSKEEIAGLKKVYQYIRDYTFDDTNKFNIHELCTLHSMIYSHTPFPEYASHYRTQSAILACCQYEFVDYSEIPKLIYELNEDFNRTKKHSSKPEDYITNAVNLHAKLMKTLPFSDGNGRSIRAIFNLQLKYIGLPPIYIEPQEKQMYCSALQMAIAQDDTTKLEQLFFFKIANAIIEYDENFSKEAI